MHQYSRPLSDSTQRQESLAPLSCDHLLGLSNVVPLIHGDSKTDHKHRASILLAVIQFVRGLILSLMPVVADKVAYTSLFTEHKRTNVTIKLAT